MFRNAGLDFDLVAEGGANNVWIAECGSEDEWPGGFAAFRAALAAAEVEVRPTATAFDVVYTSPTRGQLALGWDGPLGVNGVPQALSDYPRFDNPFVRTDFDTTRYEVSDGRYGLLLDFERDQRETSGPGPGQSRRDEVHAIRDALRDASLPPGIGRPRK